MRFYYPYPISITNQKELVDFYENMCNCCPNKWRDCSFATYKRCDKARKEICKEVNEMLQSENLIQKGELNMSKEWNQEAKSDAGKNRLDLVFPSIIEELGFIRTYGSKKYKDPENWARVEEAKTRYTAAAMRHFEEWRKGNKFDTESGLRHLSHCACNLMFLIELERREEDEGKDEI